MESEGAVVPSLSRLLLLTLGSFIAETLKRLAYAGRLQPVGAKAADVSLADFVGVLVRAEHAQEGAAGRVRLGTRRGISGMLRQRVRGRVRRGARISPDEVIARAVGLRR